MINYQVLLGRPVSQKCSQRRWTLIKAEIKRGLTGEKRTAKVNEEGATAQKRFCHRLHITSTTAAENDVVPLVQTCNFLLI